jgi:hypothetical protein
VAQFDVSGKRAALARQTLVLGKEGPTQFNYLEMFCFSSELLGFGLDFSWNFLDLFIRFKTFQRITRIPN